VKTWFQAFAFKRVNLYRRYGEAPKKPGFFAKLQAKLFKPKKKMTTNSGAASFVPSPMQFIDRIITAKVRLILIDTVAAYINAGCLRDCKVGLCKLNPVVRHSLKAPGFNP
jgi:hypothetical protein